MLYALLACTIFAATSIVWSSLRTQSVPMPSSPRVVRESLELLPPHLEGTLIDLGSGWGNLVFALARRYPHCTIQGYELSPVPYLFTRLRLWLRPQRNIEFYYKDFFDQPLSEAQLLTAYVSPEVHERLAAKLQKECGEGVLVLTHTFALPGWHAFTHHRLDDLYRTPIYLHKAQSAQKSEG